MEHFLTALSQQSKANVLQIGDGIKTNINQMSETIWSTLRLALSYLNKTDLYAQCSNKNLDYLKNQFNIE